MMSNRFSQVFIAGMLWGVVVSLAAVLLVSAALAHGPADWISRGGYKNQAGELCCGERDCAELAGDDISVTAGGYYIHSVRETVPYGEALPSPNGSFWRCAWGGARKCFFATPPGM